MFGNMIVGSSLSYPDQPCTGYVEPSYPLWDFTQYPDGTKLQTALPNIMIPMYNDFGTVNYDGDWTIQNGKAHYETAGGGLHGARILVALSPLLDSEYNFRISFSINTQSVEDTFKVRAFMRDITVDNTYAFWEYNSSRRDWRWYVLRTGSVTESNYKGSGVYNYGVSFHHRDSYGAKIVGGTYTYSGNCGSALSQYASDGYTTNQQILEILAFNLNATPANAPGFSVDWNAVGLCYYDEITCVTLQDIPYYEGTFW